MDAVETAAAIRSGLLTSAEACAESIKKIETLDAMLNAVVIDLFESAIEAGAKAEGPFAGVPTLLKDLGGCLAGLPLYQGSQLLRQLDWRALDDAPIAKRIVDAGFVIVGKTNTPEFGAGVSCQPTSFGATRNPWNTDYSTSGSSGGAAAAVAAGLVPVAHGNDFGGSIRLPAAWCGVIGLKPSRGRVDTSSPPGPLAEFVLTRSLRDTAALLDVLADDGNGALEGRPHGGWLHSHSHPPRRSRIGLVTAVEGVDTDRDGAIHAGEAARTFSEAGHEIVELDAGFLADHDWDPMQLIVRSRGARTRLDALATLAGRELDEHDAEPLMLALANLAETFTEAQAVSAGEWQLRYASSLSDKWRRAGVDAIVTPTTGIGVQTIEAMAPPRDDPVRIYEAFRRIGCFAGCWNMTGHPAISIPWWTPPDDVLPAGIQIITAPGDEDHLLRLANQLSDFRPARTAVRQPPQFTAGVRSRSGNDDDSLIHHSE